MRSHLASRDNSNGVSSSYLLNWQEKELSCLLETGSRYSAAGRSFGQVTNIVAGTLSDGRNSNYNYFVEKAGLVDQQFGMMAAEKEP